MRILLPGLARRFGALGLLVAGVACDDDGTGPPPLGLVSLEIVAPDSVVDLGAPLELSVSVRDDVGTSIPDVAIEWSSGDASTATVTDGTVTGSAIGYVEIVAAHETLADTVRLRVRDASLPLARTRVRLGDASFELSGFMRFNDTMADGPGDQAGLTGFGAGLGRDTSLTIIFPGDAHAGRMAIARYPLGGELLAGPVVLLRFGSNASGDLEYWASVGEGWVDLHIEDAPAPGWRTGTARGFAHVPLVRLAPGPGAPVLTTDTLLLHANAHARLQHVIRGHAVVTIDDGPLTGTSVLSSTQADEHEYGGYFTGWNADFDGLGSGPGRWELNQEFRIASPDTGLFYVPRFAGEQFDDPSIWPSRFSSLFYRDDPRVALIADGTVRITEWLPPTDEDFGRMVGVLDGRFELWSDFETPTGDTVHAVSSFSLAIPPLAGLPGVAEPPSTLPLASAPRPFGTAGAHLRLPR